MLSCGTRELDGKDAVFIDVCIPLSLSSVPLWQLVSREGSDDER